MGKAGADGRDGIVKSIQNAAIVILAGERDGLRHSELVRALWQSDPGWNRNTVIRCVSILTEKRSDLVYKPARGLLRHTSFREDEAAANGNTTAPVPKSSVKEEEFYGPFAEWLVEEVEEATKAVPIGGNIFRDKWGTPDVIGIKRPRVTDIIKAPDEIVAAEIKLDTGQLVTAFGQACAYCLFSHRTYLVVPKTSPPDELARLDGLCQVFGIGLVLFDSAKPSDPAFSIRVRPRYQQVDLFYTNENLKRVADQLF